MSGACPTFFCNTGSTSNSHRVKVMTGPACSCPEPGSTAQAQVASILSECPKCKHPPDPFKWGCGQYRQLEHTCSLAISRCSQACADVSRLPTYQQAESRGLTLGRESSRQGFDGHMGCQSALAHQQHSGCLQQCGCQGSKAKHQNRLTQHH